MRLPRPLLVLLSLVALPAGAGAAYMAPFERHDCAWFATHIVVVTEGDTIDGVVTVLESWKGDYKPGATITVPGLAHYAAEDDRLVGGTRAREMDRLVGQPEAPRVTVTCKRMVLFLVKRTEAEIAKPSIVTWTDDGVPRRESPWGRTYFMRGFDAEIAWIEGKKVYACHQFGNPGPYVIDEQPGDEAKLKADVAATLAVEAKFRAALAADETGQRLAAEVPVLLGTDLAGVTGVLFRAIGEAGAKALPVLRCVLSDVKLWGYHCWAISALGHASGWQIEPDFAALLAEDAAYWKATGPTLPKGWSAPAHRKWPPAPGEEPRPRDRLYRTETLLYQMDGPRASGSKSRVAEFKRLWLSVPQLAEATGIPWRCDQISAQP